MINFNDACRLARLDSRMSIDEQDCESLTDCLENPLDESDQESCSPLDFRQKGYVDPYFPVKGGKMKFRKYEPEAWDLYEEDLGYS